MFNRNKVKPIEHILVSDKELLSFILKIDKYRNYLVNETRKTYTNENLEFLIDVNSLYLLKTKTAIQNQIQYIYKTYIETNVLNIQSHETNHIKANFTKSFSTFNVSLYDKAFWNIFQLVISNDIRRLKKEPIFPEIIQEILLTKKKNLSNWNLLKSIVYFTNKGIIGKRLTGRSLSIIV